MAPPLAGSRGRLARLSPWEGRRLNNHRGSAPRQFPDWSFRSQSTEMKEAPRVHILGASNTSAGMNLGEHPDKFHISWRDFEHQDGLGADLDLIRNRRHGL
jgi:hypothetical protein